MIELSNATVRAVVDPRGVFALWDDPTSWPTWDPDVTWVQLDGPATLGVRGRLKPRSGPATTFAVTDRIEGERLVDETRLPGATLTFDHRVAPREVDGRRGSEIAVSITVDGPLARVWALPLRRALADGARTGITGLLAHLGVAP